MLIRGIAGFEQILGDMLHSEYSNCYERGDFPWLAKFLYKLRMEPELMGLPEHTVEEWLLKVGNNVSTRSSVAGEVNNIISNYISRGFILRELHSSIPSELLIALALRTKEDANTSNSQWGFDYTFKVIEFVNKLVYSFTDPERQDLKRVIESKARSRSAIVLIYFSQKC